MNVRLLTKHTWSKPCLEVVTVLEGRLLTPPEGYNRRILKTTIPVGLEHSISIPNRGG